MIYVDFSSPDVSLNLAAEYYFASERRLDDEVLMLWQPRATIVVGSFQNIHEEVDVAYATSHGIDIVRRLSGGGTVYQDNGSIQYAFIGEGEREINFKRYLEPVIAALRRLGIDAEADGRNDICVGGRKVSGNAQYRVGDVVIHHGTLLFSADLDEMERACRPPEYKIASKSIKSVRERVVNMCTLTDRVKTPEEFMRFTVDALSPSARLSVSEEDLRRIEQIAEERFREERKNGYAVRSPAFSFEKSVRFDGGLLTLSCEVKGGRIISARLGGDFFTACRTEPLVDSLVGCAFTREAVRRALLESDFDVMGMDNATLSERLSENI